MSGQNQNRGHKRNKPWYSMSRAKLPLPPVPKVPTTPPITLPPVSQQPGCIAPCPIQREKDRLEQIRQLQKVHAEKCRLKDVDKTRPRRKGEGEKIITTVAFYPPA